jgi:hypothetical protein
MGISSQIVYKIVLNMIVFDTSRLKNVIAQRGLAQIVYKIVLNMIVFDTSRLKNVIAQRGARTHDPEIKSNALPTELAGLLY